MSDQHLSYFKVENFKCFESLEVEDIGQFNLIVGDNNVGKTSLLEALMVEEDFINFSLNLYKSLEFRGHPISQNNLSNTDLWETFTFNNSNIIKFNLDKDTVFSISKSDILNGYIWEIGGNFNQYKIQTESETFSNKEIRENTFRKKLLIDRFIYLNVLSNEQIVELYDKVIGANVNKLEVLENNLKEVLLPSLKRIVFKKLNAVETILFARDGESRMLPFSSFGEGTVRVFQVLLELNQFHDRLMIDEIDTGIHYSRMKDFLKKLILLAEKNDTQLFMTTHSEECQRFFIELFNEDEELQNLQPKVRHIEMYRNKNGLIKAATRDFGVTLESLKMGMEIRR